MTVSSNDQHDDKNMDKDMDKDKDNEKEKEVELTATAGKEVSQSKIDANSRKGHGGKIFPDPFYCPITKKVMDNPVVLSDGVSYEKSAVASRGDKMYPNRALKAIIDDAVEASGKSFRAVALRVQHSMKKVFNETLEKSLIPSRKYRPLPDVYYCPITFSLIHEPVIDPEGTTFEKVAIVKWIRENGTSPLTRTELSIEDLFPNLAIKELLNIEKKRDESSMHPSIRNFKNEEPPKMNSDIDSPGDVVVGDVRFEDFPTNHDELTESERRRDRLLVNKVSCIALIFTILLLLLGLAMTVTTVPLFLCLLIFCCSITDHRSENGESESD